MDARRCRHFTGIQHTRCAAGVRYVDVTGATGGLPCLLGEKWGNLDPRQCELQELESKEVTQARAARFRAAAKRIARGD